MRSRLLKDSKLSKNQERSGTSHVHTDLECLSVLEIRITLRQNGFAHRRRSAHTHLYICTVYRAGILKKL